MLRLRLTGAALLGAAVMAFAPASAMAVSPVVRDCQAHNGLKSHYSTQQLRAALKTMPPTIAEYSNCQQVITNQLNAQLSQSSKGGSQNGQPSSGGSSSVLVIVVVVVVVLIVAGGGLVYSRRRTGGGGSEEPPPPDA